MVELARKKDLTGVQERQSLHSKIINGACPSAIYHRITSIELSQEEI